MRDIRDKDRAQESSDLPCARITELHRDRSFEHHQQEPMGGRSKVGGELGRSKALVLDSYDWC